MLPEGVEGGLGAGLGGGGCRARGGGLDWGGLGAGRDGRGGRAGGGKEEGVGVFWSLELVLFVRSARRGNLVAGVRGKGQRTMHTLFAWSTVPESLSCSRVKMLVYSIGR